MPRIIFPKGRQRVFFDDVIRRTSSPSLRGLIQFGIKTNYSTLKNYYLEDRTLPEELFIQLCSISLISKESIIFSLVKDNWGKVKGGKKSKRK